MKNNNKHLFPYVWYLKDGYPAQGIKKHGLKVFGTFICGGGSSMGYKLAGFEHLGGVELDPKVAETYKENHHPKYLFNLDIRDFNKLTDLPTELYNLDILDGSPPCSTFSTVGSREDAWGKEKKFSEGQKKQTLDDLVFVYCDTIKKLMPKVCLLENVSGLIKGNGKVYCKKIVEKITAIGYNVQVFLLNAATMGVPQKRERVFIIGCKNDYKLPKLKLNFAEPPIVFGDFIEKNKTEKDMTDFQYNLWKKRKPSDLNLGDIVARTENGRLSAFTKNILHKNRIPYTLTASSETFLYDYPRQITPFEMSCISTFPQDFKVLTKTLKWYTGMSVPPIMTAQIANQIYLQWLSKI